MTCPSLMRILPIRMDLNEEMFLCNTLGYEMTDLTNENVVTIVDVLPATFSNTFFHRFTTSHQ